jgi:nicotinate-nucleotide pyrophosphorylase (carboxylating)
MNQLKEIVRQALAEDIGEGDVTSQLLIPQTTLAAMRFVAREPMVACGCEVPLEVYRQLGNVEVRSLVKDGVWLKAGDVLAEAVGDARMLLTGERVALNLMQRMSGVATMTRRYVETIAGTKAVLLDTRKTMPLLRMLDKYAVRCGGGQNHRMRLDDMVLIKDNHIALAGSIAQAIHKARAGTTLPLVVECDTLSQVREALSAKPDRILLDNMSLDQLREAVALSAGSIPLEASGGVLLATIRDIAQTGVDFISVGAITHSAVAVDIGGDIEIRG